MPATMNSQANYVEPTQAEQSFRQSFDLEDPATASESYARYVTTTAVSLLRNTLLTPYYRRMHMHTMQQLETAARSANRRASAAPSHSSSMSSESSMESEQGDL